MGALPQEDVFQRRCQRALPAALQQEHDRVPQPGDMLRGRLEHNRQAVLGIKAGKPGEAGYNDIHVNKFIVEKDGLKMVVLHWFMWRRRHRAQRQELHAHTARHRRWMKARKRQRSRRRISPGLFFQEMYKPVAKSGSIGAQIIDAFGPAGYADRRTGLLLSPS